MTLLKSHNALDHIGNLTSQVVNALGFEIVQGRIDSEIQSITEAELVNRYSVSRNTVREAVKILCSKGLLFSSPRKGISIMPKEQWNLFDSQVLLWSLEGNESMAIRLHVAETRKCIELNSSVLATSSHNKLQLQSIWSAFECLQKNETSASFRLKHTYRFHESIIRASNNPFFISMLPFIEIAINDLDQLTILEKFDTAIIVKDAKTLIHGIENRKHQLVRETMANILDICNGHLERLVT